MGFCIKDSVGNIDFSPQCPMPNAQCPMPNAPCPMPNAQCPIL
ncbi:hypothetical protein [Tolypothrix sp. FACHB-123]|nr:hypothetical protein [Tolypothrix sp. FACHB-123]